MTTRRAVALVSLVCVGVASCSGSGGGTTSSGADGTGATSSSMGAEAGAETGAEAPPVFVTESPVNTGEVGLPEQGEPSLVTPPSNEAPLPPATGLRVAATTLCPTIGESFDVSVSAVPPPNEDGSPVEPFDVTASITLTQTLGDGLELLSQGDAAISLQMTSADIVAMRADFPEGNVPGDVSTNTTTAFGQTVYVGGFPADAPPDVLLSKLVPGGCLFALRLPSRNFCGTALSRGGSASLGTGDTIVAIDNCDVTVPDELPLIVLPASNASRDARS